MIKTVVALFIFTLNVSFAYADKSQLLASDQQALQARVDIIEQAESEILVEYFSVWNDEQSVGGFALLLEAARRGVKVKVIMDALANTVPRSLISAMIQKGLNKDGQNNFEIKVYNPISLNLKKALHRDHAKLLIVDKKIAISGGRNVGRKYFGFHPEQNYKDLDVIFAGKSVAAAHKNFMEVWEGPLAVSPLLYENATEKLLENACVPTMDNYDQCENMRQAAVKEHEKQVLRIAELTEQLKSFADDTTGLITGTKKEWLADVPDMGEIEFLSHENAITNSTNNTMAWRLREIALEAKDQLLIVSPYLIPTDGVKELFKALIARGVKVSVITNSLASTDNVFAQAGYRYERSGLIKMGVEIYEYKGPSTLHAKMAIVDETIGLVGTFNLDPRSELKNREVGFAVRGNPDFIRDLKSYYEESKQGSKLVAFEGVQHNADLDNEGVSGLKKFLIKLIMPFVPLIKNQL